VEARNEKFAASYPTLDEYARKAERLPPRPLPETPQDAAIRSLREKMDLLKHVQGQSQLDELRARATAVGVKPAPADIELTDEEVARALEARRKFQEDEAKRRALTSGN
jgi:hypothetical protein